MYNLNWGNALSRNFWLIWSYVNVDYFYRIACWAKKIYFFHFTKFTFPRFREPCVRKKNWEQKKHFFCFYFSSFSDEFLYKKFAYHKFEYIYWFPSLNAIWKITIGEYQNQHFRLKFLIFHLLFAVCPGFMVRVLSNLRITRADWSLNDINSEVLWLEFTTHQKRI